MYTRIVVPLDGSPRAERSVPVAAMLARSTHGSIILVHVLRTIGEFGPIIPTASNAAILDEERHEANAYLTRIAGLPVMSGIPTETGVFTGQASMAILDAVVAHKADAIVITSHGRTGMSRWALGSVAEHVVRHARVPVLMLREQGDSPAERLPDREYRPQVLVPLDGSSLSETALEPAAELAKALTAPAPGSLHLMLVVSPFETAEARLEDEVAIETTKSYLTAVAAKVRAQHNDVSVTWSIAIDTDAASGIIRVAEVSESSERTSGFGKYDVLAMATHGRTGLSRWMLGSTTERVLHATQVPMLVVRPGPVQAQERVTEEAATQESEPPDIPAWSALF